MNGKSESIVVSFLTPENELLMRGFVYVCFVGIFSHFR